MAIPICRRAERLLPRRGPGRPGAFADWAGALPVLIAVVKRRTTKGAQYRFLHEHRRPLIRWLGRPRCPARSTPFGRYRRAARRLAPARKVHAAWLAPRRRVDARCVA